MTRAHAPVSPWGLSTVVVCCFFVWMDRGTTRKPTRDFLPTRPFFVDRPDSWLLPPHRLLARVVPESTLPACDIIA